MSLHVLAYNFKRFMTLLGVGSLGGNQGVCSYTGSTARVCSALLTDPATKAGKYKQRL